MSWWTKTRDAVTSTVAPIATAGLGLAGGPTGLLTGGLTGPLGGMAGITGLMGLLGGGAMGGGGLGTSPMSGATSSFGSSTTPGIDPSQFGSLMDMLSQNYGQNQTQVSPAGTANLSNQGLV